MQLIYAADLTAFAQQNILPNLERNAPVHVTGKPSVQ